MIAITGATGQLGRLVIHSLLAAQVSPSQIVALVRDPAKAVGLVDLGVTLRIADYNQLASLDAALAGVEKLLLISSNEIGQRLAQHQNVIDAAQSAGVKLLVYTSLLHADTSTLSLADEHWQTEKAIRRSGVPSIILRNGWYTENYTGFLKVALANGAIIGSAGEGKISSAAREDYADAAAAALTGKALIGRTYELAGDTAYTLAELAAEVSRQSGREIPYQDLPVATYAGILASLGLPPALAEGLPSFDLEASRGALYDASGELSRLIGRPTTPLAEAVRQALA